MSIDKDALHKSLSDTLIGHQKELRDTLRNLAILAGAIAVGAMVLLGVVPAVTKAYVLIAGLFRLRRIAASPF